MSEEKFGREFINSISPVIESGKVVYGNVGTVKPVRIYETMQYVEKKNVDNTAVYQAYRALMDVCFVNGVVKADLKEEDFNKALADYTEVLKKSVGLIKDAPAITPTGDTKTETSKEDAPKTKG